MKLSIILPVYNEKKYLVKLINKILAVKLPIEREIIIIESNSTDGSKEIVKKYESKKGFKVIYEDKANGKGFAVRNGFKMITGDIILIQDADLEYNPNDYNKLIEPILKKQTKFVIGSRKMGKKTWMIRKQEKNISKITFINIIAHFADLIFNLLYGVNITDPQSMYKVFHKDCLKGINFKSNYFNLDWEICAKFIRKGYIPLEIPVYYKSRSFNEGKKIRLIRDIFLNTYSIIKYRFF